jgi:hypothetical protein
MQGTRRLQIRRSSIDVETVAKSNNTSHMFYEDMLSHREGIRGAPIMEVLRNNVKRKNVESFLHEVIEEVATHGNDHIENPIQNNASGREGCDRYYCCQYKLCTRPKETDSAMGTTELGSSVGKDQE